MKYDEVFETEYVNVMNDLSTFDNGIITKLIDNIDKLQKVVKNTIDLTPDEEKHMDISFGLLSKISINFDSIIKSEAFKSYLHTVYLTIKTLEEQQQNEPA